MSLPKEKMVQKNYTVVTSTNGVPIKVWNKHVKIEDAAMDQLLEVSRMPFVKPYVAAMPDTHWGMGATVGSVIPTQGAVMPAAVGVDIGCGMMAVRTTIPGKTLYPLFAENMKLWYDEINRAVPSGRTNNGGEGDRGGWGTIPADIAGVWEKELMAPYAELTEKHPGALSRNAEKHLGTLGTGNHFIEICQEIDNPDSNLWVVIHSGSRGLGNRIGTYFTKLAGNVCKEMFINLPNRDLGYFAKGTPFYNDYIGAVQLAQKFAWLNREIMMARVLKAIGGEEMTVMGFTGEGGVPSRIHMHHNYAHVGYLPVGKDCILTRKGAVDASKGKWCIIPGSMGAKTYLGIGLGSKDSFDSCSHGAGRAMSRTQALKTFTVADHQKATEGVYCDKTDGVLDETPAAYKDIDAVMASQEDLVEARIKLKQIVCVKGISD